LTKDYEFRTDTSVAIIQIVMTLLASQPMRVKSSNLPADGAKLDLALGRSMVHDALDQGGGALRVAKTVGQSGKARLVEGTGLVAHEESAALAKKAHR